MCASQTYMDVVFSSCVSVNSGCDPTNDMSVWHLAPTPKYLFMLHKIVVGFTKPEAIMNVIGVFVAANEDECTELLTQHLRANHQGQQTSLFTEQWAFFISHDVHPVNSVPLFGVRSKVCYLEYSQPTRVEVKVHDQVVYTLSNKCTYDQTLDDSRPYVVQVINEPDLLLKTIHITTVDEVKDARLLHYHCMYCDEPEVEVEKRKREHDPEEVRAWFKRPKLMVEMSVNSHELTN